MTSLADIHWQIIHSAQRSPFMKRILQFLHDSSGWEMNSTKLECVVQLKVFCSSMNMDCLTCSFFNSARHFSNCECFIYFEYSSEPLWSFLQLSWHSMNSSDQLKVVATEGTVFIHILMTEQNINFVSMTFAAPAVSSIPEKMKLMVWNVSWRR